MNNSERINKPLAEDYFQAATCGCDMFRITEILEEFRTMVAKSEGFRKIEDRLDIHLGENLENDKEFKIILQLRQQLIQLKKENYQEELSKVFQSDEQKGWLRWLEIFGKELSKVNREICNFLLEMKVPDENADEYRFIKNHFPYISEERWVEGNPLFEMFIGKDHIDQDVRADLHILAGAIQLYHLLEYDNAFNHFKEAKKLQPDAARTERIFGEYFVQQKKFGKARDYLQKALDLDKKDFENYIVLGNLYKAENRYEAAASWYNQGIQENPGKADLYNRLLLLNDHPDYFKKHSAEINPLLENIIKLDPEFTYTALNNAAFVYQKNQEFNQAEEYYKKAIQLFPERVQSYCNLGYFWLDKDELKKSEEAFQKTIELDPQSFDGYWGLVALCRRKEDWKGVIQNLEICEKYRPEWLSYFYSDYGNAYEKLKDPENAQKYYLRALECDPEKKLGLIPLCDIAELDLDVESGISLLKKIRDIKGESFEADFHYRTAIIYYKNSQFQKAVEHFEAANSIDPGNPVKLEYLGLAWEKSGNYEKAEYHYREAIENAEDNKSKFYNRLGFFLTERERYEEAAEMLKKAIELKPASLYYENLGYACENLGRRDEALKHYKTALEISEHDKDIYLNRLGVFYFNHQEYEKALGFYQQAIDLQPKAVYYENIGNAYNSLGDKQLFENAFLKATELEPSEGKYYFQLGLNILQKYGDSIKSKQYLNKSIEIYKQTPEIEPEELMSIQFLGAAYQKEGNLDKAQEIFMEAYEIDPGN
ncbi:MAG: tetratricopeptide repeat protein, partial [Prolixibacteraceae bacterium]